MQKLIEQGKLIVNTDKLYDNRDFTKQEDFSASGASLDLLLGEDVFVTPDEEPRKLKKHEVINIKPGQFAALITEEELYIPKDYIGFITVRFSYKSKGLVNISGFHVDPGFKGKLVFSVYNTGSTTVSLRRGESVFSLFLSHIKVPKDGEDKEKFGYNGKFQNMNGIPLSIIEPLAGAKVPSMNELEDKVKKNETYIKVYGAILLGLLGAIIALFLNSINLGG